MWSKWVRQIHRWLSIIFTVTVIANFVALARGGGGCRRLGSRTRRCPHWLCFFSPGCTCSCCRMRRGGGGGEAAGGNCGVNTMVGKTSRKSVKGARKAAAKRVARKPKLLSGGNPRSRRPTVTPVRSYIASVPGWKRDSTTDL